MNNKSLKILTIVLLATLTLSLSSVLLAHATAVELVKEHHPLEGTFTGPGGYAGYVPGDTVQFHGHINVTTVSDGPILSISDLIITDILPPNTTYVTGSQSSTPPATFTDFGNGILQWDFGPGPFTTVQLDGWQASVEFELTIDSDAPDDVFLTNQISADYTETITQVESSPDTTDTIYTAHPILDIAKECDMKIGEGDAITYIVTLTNTGSLDAENVMVTDVLPAVIYSGGASATSGTIDDTTPGLIVWTGTVPAGGSVVITIPVVDDPADISTLLTDTVSYTGYPDFAEVLNVDATCETVVIHPAIDLVKEVDPAKVIAGTEVTYTYNVTNTGDTTLSDVSIVDDQLGIIASGLTLAPGEWQAFNALAVINVDTTNIATASGFDQLGNEVTDTATTDVEVISPAIDVTKTCEAIVPTAPGTIEWTITVMNTGDVDLDVTVTDTQHGIVFDDIIAAGGMEVIVITDTDLAAGTYVNEVTADGVHQLGTVSDSDVATCEITGAFEGLTPGFWKNHLCCWVGHDPDDLFSDVFGVVITINKGSSNEITDPTLLEALNAMGGANEKKGVYDALARQAVAALLNAAHPEINYPWTEAQIIDAVYEAITNASLTDAEPLKNLLDMYNNYGGGIDAHCRPI